MTTKTILLTSVILSLMITIIGFEDAFAETEKELREIAKQSKFLDDDRKEKIKQGKYSEANDIKIKYDKLIKKLNDHGLATVGQFEQNPEYWLALRAEIQHPSLDSTDSLNTVENVNQKTYRNNFFEAHSHCTCGPDKLKYMAGYTIIVWGIKWVNYAEEGWTENGLGEDAQSDRTINEGDGADVRPIFITESKNTPMTMDWDSEWVLADSSGGVLEDDPIEPFLHYFANSQSNKSKEYPLVYDVDDGSEITFIQEPQAFIHP